MIGYYWSAYKLFWYFYTTFSTLVYFTYIGMLLVSITPSFPIAAISQSTFYTMLNLFSGFLIPRPVSSFFETKATLISFLFIYGKNFILPLLKTKNFERII